MEGRNAPSVALKTDAVRRVLLLCFRLGNHRDNARTRER
jgi:hypothetical protein